MGQIQTQQYHKETYGTTFNYDDFAANFTGKNFDAKAWMQLISDAGAKYVVPVTSASARLRASAYTLAHLISEHHDGFALFNFPTSISTRSSVHLGPKRDFIKELLDTAKSSFPSIRRGVFPGSRMSQELTGVSVQEPTSRCRSGIIPRMLDTLMVAAFKEVRQLRRSRLHGKLVT